MKKGAMMFTILTAAVLILGLTALCVRTVKSETAYNVEWVNHRVEVLYDGYIFVNDTIKINGETPNSFMIGFPYEYGDYVIRCIAYDPSNQSQKYRVTTNVPLEEGRMGFYGINVSLNPQPTNGIFTVGFVLSNSLIEQNSGNTSLFTLNFPAYPSLTVNASACNASVILPRTAEYLSGTIENFDYAENKELESFAYQPANVTFRLTTGEIQLFTVEEFKREISVSSTGEVEISDNYYVKSRARNRITSLKVAVLPNASNLVVEDEFGRKGSSPTLSDTEKNLYNVTLPMALEAGGATRFIVKYSLPSSIYACQSENGGTELSFEPFKNINHYIENAWITFSFPEGARVVDISTNTLYEVTKGVFQETFTARTQNVLFLDDVTIKIVYAFNPLWLSLRPTLWVWALATFGCVIALVWKRPKAPTPVQVTVPTTTSRFSPEMIKSFVDAYEERRKIASDMKSLENAVNRGRIPRQRYKVQRKTLETRLGTVSRNLDDLRLRLRAVGGRYMDLMHQLEVAETELKEVEANVKSIEARHKRGELTLEAYRKLLSDYERRKEKAETTINGILVRLREEIR